MSKFIKPLLYLAAAWSIVTIEAIWAIHLYSTLTPEQLQEQVPARYIVYLIILQVALICCLVAAVRSIRRISK